MNAATGKTPGKFTLSRIARVGKNLARINLRKANPWLLRISLEDYFGAQGATESSRKHLDATMQWLCCAQDRCGGHGVSAGYSFIDGWYPPYPETTGYLIPTFYDYAALSGREECRDRARRMADWEINIQLPCGGVQGGHYVGPTPNRSPVVFNTGQVIQGWRRAYDETADERYLDAARRAADWLISVQSKDGAWRVDGPSVSTLVHAYDARSAWGLLEVEAMVNDGRYAEAAHRNLEWTLRQQRTNGWFANNNFVNYWLPPTHSIAYVMEGLIESERLSGEPRYLTAARKTAETLLKIYDMLGFMPGEFDCDWSCNGNFSCLTGNAQIARVWLQLFQKTGEEAFLRRAIGLNKYVKTSQKLRSLHSGVRGGVKGSFPLGGFYQPYCYPNWSAKFLADSLILEERVFNDIGQGDEERIRPHSARTAAMEAHIG
jgi:uncharacterized protein YyaL (SSP411 family)